MKHLLKHRTAASALCVREPVKFYAISLNDISHEMKVAPSINDSRVVDTDTQQSTSQRTKLAEKKQFLLLADHRKQMTCSATSLVFVDLIRTKYEMQ